MSNSTHLELPQAEEAERSVLGAILVDNDHFDEIADMLREDDFYRTAHRRIFRCMQALADDSQPIDLITLHDRHQNDGTLD